MARTPAAWMEVYEERSALWTHDGDPRRPHVLLNSGKHSNGFFDSRLVMEDPVLLSEACLDLSVKLEREGLLFSEVDRVVGPAKGAITLAHEMARQISQWRPRPCLTAYTEREGDREVFSRVQPKPGETILIVEDVLTTGASIERVVGAVTDANCSPLLVMAVLVNRSDGAHVPEDREGPLWKIAPLITQPMPAWEPQECPLCRLGSSAIRPEGENLGKLNKAY